MIVKKYTDVAGRLQYRLLRTEHDDPTLGIPLSIPDLSGLLLPEFAITELHNELIELGLITWPDIVRSQNAITRATRRVCTRYGIDDQTAGNIRRAVIELYRTRR